MSDRFADRRGAGTWRRWEMGAFEKPAPFPAQASAPPAPDVEFLRAEVRRLRDAAQARGHAEGYAAGHAQGLAEGAEAGSEAGRRQGYEAGFEAGRQAGRDLAEQEAARLQALARACADSMESINAEMGQALIALAINIAEQVLRGALRTQPDRILDLVREVVQVDGGKEARLKLRLNPADLELVRAYLDDEGLAGAWRLLPDASIARGGCIAETALGSIDATLQTRWRRVTAALGHPGALDGEA